MKLFIFGANGMLGYYLVNYLSAFFEIVPITRNEVDLNDDFTKISEKYNFEETDVIINAAGIIKQRKYSATELIRVNSLFPHFLSTLNCKVIHITTDCVFSGKDGSYDEESPHDCLDDYGKSKSLGECEDLTVIRTSIIGEELNNKKSLIEWVKSNIDTEINGYLNHFWNGVTCLELAKHIKDIIDNNSYWEGIRHYHSPDTVSKYQLVSYINDAYELNNTVIPTMSYFCDRSLKTKYNSPVKLTIKEQLNELKQFNLSSSLSLSRKEKLKNFPSINFISVKGLEERREILYKSFEECGLTKIHPRIYDVYKEGEYIIDFEDCSKEHVYGSSYLGAFTSHLKAIKEWYDTTDEEYGFFCEDDISFETVDYWNFTWEEFLNQFPPTWQCVQLSLTRTEGRMFEFFTPEVHFRPRCWCDWAAVAHIMKRSHAKKIIDHYYDGEKFSLGYKGIDKHLRPEWAYRPIIETTIYSIFGYDEVYTFPLFVENIQFISSVWGDCDDYSYVSIMDWWKKRGRYMKVENLFSFL